MKTGRNHNGYSRAYIYQYMHNKKINNEKAWMKSEGIAPALKKCGDKRCIETSSNDKKINKIYKIQDMLERFLE